MSGIVCAIRGGPASRPTIDKAIDVASEKGLVLYFPYVVNIDFLDHTIRNRVQTISQQMQQRGEFIILSAQATAKAKGIEAQGLVRHGKVNEIRYYPWGTEKNGGSRTSQKAGSTMLPDVKYCAPTKPTESC